mmetsp:Transcript_7378/g.16167  ORF Transcript_7378/g.16167 Transcript_7378/m.16167 type:complete len:658 (-) Transcript_7378:71-2044(-)
MAHDVINSSSFQEQKGVHHYGHLRLAQYPLQLGLAYLFLFGYFCRCIFVSLRLPASVGVMLSGLAFSYCFQDGIFKARSDLQELSFFLVLLTAGLDISLQDLRVYTFIMAWLPPTLELLGITTYAVLCLDFEIIEGLVLGTTLFAVGDGLVIPKMKEFQNRFPQHPLPFLVFSCVPLEASYALALFGIFKGMSHPEAPHEENMDMIVFANVLRILATLAAGSLIGLVAAEGISTRKHLKCFGRPVFTGQPVEAFLVLISAGLISYGLGSSESGKEVVPMFFSHGSMFQPELMVIVTASVFSERVAEEDLHQIERILGGVWVFGQVMLFSMLGSRTRLKVFAKIVDIVPILGIGLFARVVGVLCAMLATAKSRPCLTEEDLRMSSEVEQDLSPDSPSKATRSRGLSSVRSCDEIESKRLNTASFWPDATFCFLSCLPRATIQGALGSVPLMQGFFHKSTNNAQVDVFINTAAKLYIVVMAVIGMLLLQWLGPRMLETSEAWAREARNSQSGYAPVQGDSAVRLPDAAMEHATELTRLAQRLDILPAELEQAVKEVGLILEAPQSPVVVARHTKRIHTGATHQFEVLGEVLSPMSTRSAQHGGPWGMDRQPSLKRNRGSFASLPEVSPMHDFEARHPAQEEVKPELDAQQPLRQAARSP